MFLKPVDERNRKLLIYVDVFSDQDKPEVRMDPALDTMSPQAKINVPNVTHCCVILKIKQILYREQFKYLIQKNNLIGLKSKSKSFRDKNYSRNLKQNLKTWILKKKLQIIQIERNLKTV